ncbi:MAG: hypothetical protein ACU833_02230 [Gammaproteobacteria bacterium]
MSIVTISKASKLVGKTTQTLYRHISSGKLTRKKNGIETAELIRVYGDIKLEDEAADKKSKVKKSEPKQIAPPKKSEEKEVAPLKPANDTESLWLEHLTLQEQIRDLQQEIREMREYFQKKEDRLLRIIELNLTGQNEKQGFLRKFFK